MIHQGLKLKRTWSELNLDNLKHNLLKVKNILEPKCKLMCIVKADAYGHGDKIIAEQIIDYGADILGVSNIEEALSLRRQCIKIPILILGYTPPSFVDILFKYNIIQTIFCFDYAKKISDEATKQNITIKVHLKIDTGLNRIGFKIKDNNSDFQQILNTYNLPSLDFLGIFTHFAVSDSKSSDDEKYTINQFNIFKSICNRLTNLGINVGLRHCCNSAAIIKYPYMHLDMVRAGIILYGPYIPTNLNFKPVMTLKTKISMIKNLYPGDYVSYGRRFMAKQNMKIATISVGYADGYNRLLSNLGVVSIKNQPAKILGSICMDQCMVDISNIEDNISEGDEVILFGNNICNLNHIANLINTIPYELLCNISKRVPRLYIKDDKEYTFIDYIASI